MTTNFTQMEIGYVLSNIGPEMTARINKNGNIAIRHKSNPGVQFVIYRHDRGLVLRRRIDTNSPYGVGHEMNNNKPFLSVVDLVQYFKGYMAKYPQNVVKVFK